MRLRCIRLFTVCALASLTVPLSTEASTLRSRPRDRWELRLPAEGAARQEFLARLARRFDVTGVDHSRGVVEVLAQGTLPPEWEVCRVSEKSALPFEAPRGYRDHEGVAEVLRNLAARFPAQTRPLTIGTTHEGRTMMGLEISSHPGDESLPAVLFNAAHHSRELMTVEVVLDVAETLLTGYGHDAEITRWLDTSRVLVVPVVNPDGYARVFDGAADWRKNAWKDSGEVWGVDPNRNYPAFWKACNGSSGSRLSDSYRGPSAGSEPEVRAMMDLVRRERPVANLSYHAFSELVIFPFSCAQVDNPSRQVFENLGKAMGAVIVDDNGRAGTYKVGTAPEVIYAADGTDIDWQWRDEGVVSLALEINSSRAGFQPDYTSWRDKTVQRQREGWKTVLRRLERGGVRALVEGAGLEDLTYEVDALQKAGRVAFAPPAMAPFRTRGKQGLLFQLLDDGDYELRLIRQGRVIKAMKFLVQGQTVDLGKLEL